MNKLVPSPFAQVANTIDLLTSNFVPWNIVLPQDNTGFVFLLAHMFFIEEAIGLRRESKEINCGNGALATRPIERRPWAVPAFVTDFTTDNMIANADERKSLGSSMNYRASTLVYSRHLEHAVDNDVLPGRKCYQVSKNICDQNYN